jgi:hypothetical protein
MNYLSVYFNVTSFVKWNMIYAALIDVTFFMIGMGIGQILRFLTEHKKHEGHV